MVSLTLRKLLSRTALGGMLAGMCVVSLAQGPGGQGRGPGGPGGQGGRGGGRGMSVASLPVSALDAMVKLTPDQKTKITAIHNKHVKELTALRPQQGQSFDQGAMQKMRDLNTRTTGEIEALLTPDQKTKMQSARQELRVYRMAGIPLGLYGQIKLTADQKTKLQALVPAGGGGRGAGGSGGPGGGAPGQPGGQPGGQRGGGGGGFGGFQQIREKAEAILTPAQKTQIASYLKAHPDEARGGRGGGGFGGGRGQGGPGGARP